MEFELRTLFYTMMLNFAASEDLLAEFPNTDFDPPEPNGSDTGNHYLRVKSLPVRPSVHGVNNGESRNRWILQVDIVARDGIGELKPLVYADKLRDATFPIYSELVGANHTFQVTKPPAPAPPIPLAGWFSIPVSFTVQTIH